jgi:isopentenyl diphosphate isomerase/L-lactate dehydrogenase-like FMN-dependent dehydrogenase
MARAPPTNTGFGGMEAALRKGAGAEPAPPSPARSPLDELVSIADWERAATAALTAASASRPSQTPPGTLEYYNSGAGGETTLARNARVWSDDFLLLPRCLVDVRAASPRWQLLGREVSAPFGIAPTAFQRLAHADGELATSRAAAAEGVAYCVSSFATTSLEDVAAAAGPPAPGAAPPVRLMQLYAMDNRAVTRAIVERAARTRAFAAICLTVDRPVLGRREANARTKFDIPWELHRDPNDLQGASLRAGAADAGGAEGGAGAGGGGGGGKSSLYATVSASLTWADVAWLRSITALPIVVKGVLAPEDAAAAVRAGCAAVWVSNHGGRQLDACATGADALPAVAAAVRAAEAGRRVEVWVDGGVRRGTDVVTALALGADFVFVGRPVVWGLAAAGEEGVRRVLRTLRDETVNAMQLLGAASVADIGPQHLLRLRPAPEPLQAPAGGAAGAALLAAALGFAAARALG